MANAEYQAAAADVSAALRENGGEVKIYRQVAGVPDPIEGTTGGGYELLYEGFGLLTRYTKRAIDGNTVKASDKGMLIEALGELMEEDRVVLGDVTWTIKSIDECNPSGVDLIFSKVQVRR